jgi:hypothetical protein
MLSYIIDTQFVGTVDKDQKQLQKEQDELFYQANKKVLKKKVFPPFYIITEL